MRQTYVGFHFQFLFAVENENHCDFVKLREMLIRTNMEDMREKTHTRHYELYRQKRLEQMGFTDVDSDNKPVSVCVCVFCLHLDRNACNRLNQLFFYSL